MRSRFPLRRQNLSARRNRRAPKNPPHLLLRNPPRLLFPLYGGTSVSPAPVDFPAGLGPEMPLYPLPGAGSVIRRGKRRGKPAPPIKEPTSPQPGTEPQEASPPSGRTPAAGDPLQPRILRLEPGAPAPTPVSYSQEDAAGHEEGGEEARQSSKEAGNTEGASFPSRRGSEHPRTEGNLPQEVENYLHPAANDSKTPEAEDISPPTGTNSPSGERGKIRYRKNGKQRQAKTPLQTISQQKQIRGRSPGLHKQQRRR